ncbi:MAG: N-acetylmuramoyl-L-alanine amidase [Verrucomicrobia bacterium]|nr:N-acetylmuramoyl-L-alanine amidase [Verrucomicrobiota bacterium]
MNSPALEPARSRPAPARLGSRLRRAALITACGLAILAGAGCAVFPPPGTLALRRGDEIVAAGKFIHTGTPVVLWLDPGGYDAYRVERRFSPFEASSWEASKLESKALQTPNRYGLRRDRLTAEEVARVRGGGWDLPLLRKVVDQFVIHYDVSGTSKQCFKTLHDARGLSVHFMLDLDGTIYQTLDLKERAWHATTSNTRSIGIEIANVGAYPPGQGSALDEWYQKDTDGRPRIVVPARLGESGIRTPGFIGRPSRAVRVQGTIQGKEIEQYDFTPEQYCALIRLTAALCRVFPKIRCDYPRDAAGRLIPNKLPDAALAEYQGLIGHHHIQTNKVDPGPAFQWDHVISQARQLMKRGVPTPPKKAASQIVRVRY